MEPIQPAHFADEENLLDKGKQPRQLYMLFFAEMWERFSFYGMKALLLVFMTTQLHFDDAKGNLILGSYMALVYAMPLFGGMLADRLLGYRKAVLFGGISMAMGHFVLALPGQVSFFMGMAFIITGNGFFKPNISSMVGLLYEPDDPRRDSGFSLFYMGINIGAALGAVICGWLGQQVNWHLGFGVAGIFMLMGLFVFYRGQHSLGHRGLPPDPQKLKARSPVGLKFEHLVYVGSWLAVPLFAIMLVNYTLMGYVLLPFAILSLLYLLSIAFRLTGAERTRLIAAIVMIVFSVLFWGFFEQGGGALNLFALRNVDLTFFGYTLPSTAVNNFINPFFIVIFSPIFAALWIALARKRKEPSTPLKFGLAFLQLGIGFYMFVIGAQMAGSDGLVSLAWFALGYLFISTGELCLSPIGLSMVTKLSPGHSVGLVMGFWFLASALGQYVAGLVGTLMAIPSEEGVASIPAAESLFVYSGVFEKITLISIGAGIFIMLVTPIIRKWMKGIH